MGIPRVLIPLGVVASVCTTGALAIHAVGPPQNQNRQQSLSWHSDDTRDVCVSFAMSTEQTIDIDPETLVYGEGCSKQRVQSGGIVVDQWYGRVGNNVYQIAHAIFAAKLSGKSRVDTPLDWTSHDGSIRQLFNFSDHFDIRPDEEFRSRVSCTERQGAHFFLYRCNGVRRSDYTNVLREYLLPRLNEEGHRACKQEAKNKRLELVVHLRAGDLLNPHSEDATSKKGRMAPCSFVDKIVAEPQSDKFDRIRVITEPDRKHPCLDHFVKNGVHVQSESVAADACAFMQAEHLVFGAKSTFSEALSLFNPNPVTLYDPIGGCHAHQTSSSCPRSRAIKYCIRGMDTSRSVDAKIDWLLSHPSEEINRVGMQCLD